MSRRNASTRCRMVNYKPLTLPGAVNLPTIADAGKPLAALGIGAHHRNKPQINRIMTAAKNSHTRSIRTDPPGIQGTRPISEFSSASISGVIFSIRAGRLGLLLPARFESMPLSDQNRRITHPQTAHPFLPRMIGAADPFRIRGNPF